jgi:hypothetical protein
MQIPSIYTMLFYLQTQQPRGLVSYSAQPQRLGMSGFYTYFAVYAGGAIFWQARPAASARACFGCNAIRTPQSAPVSARVACTAWPAAPRQRARPAPPAAFRRAARGAGAAAQKRRGGRREGGWAKRARAPAGGCVLHDAARVHPAGVPDLPRQRAGRLLGRLHSLGQLPGRAVPI